MSQEQEIFILAEHALLAVVNQIRDDQWQLPATSIPHWGDDVPSLRDLVNRHAYDDIWVPETLAGKSIEQIGSKYDGDLLGDSPKTRFAEIMNNAIKAVEDFTELDKIVHLTYGDFPAREYLKHITTFRGFRAYTIAKFLGVDATLPPALVQGLWDEVVPEVEQWRAMGVFGPAIDPPEEADQQTKLLCLTGFYQA